MMVGGGGVLTMGDYRDHYSRRGGCSGGWDFFFDHLISIKIVYLMISFVFYHYTCIFNHHL